jgi:hypothetical protein
MKRLLAVSGLTLVLIGSVMATSVVKFSFPDVTYPNGQVGTIRAGVKTTKKSNVTVCDYFSDPNDQYLGQFQDGTFASDNATEVLNFCLEHFDERQ